MDTQHKKPDSSYNNNGAKREVLKVKNKKNLNYTGQIYCTIEQIKQGQVAAQYS